MNFITPSALLIAEKDPHKKIELAGRTCYKSEDKITDESAPKFTRGLIKSNHTAMVEHHVFVFEVIGAEDDENILSFLEAVDNCPYIHVTNEFHSNGDIGWRRLISGNVRALNEWDAAAPLVRVMAEQYPDLAYGPAAKCANYIYTNIKARMVDIEALPDLSHTELAEHFNMTFRFITDRGVTHELVRHRPASYGQESTRYVNYKAGINIALPTGFYEKPEEVQAEYEAAFWDAERHYIKLIELNEKPQQARAVLPTALKTEIVMTTTLKEWEHVFNLRLWGTTGAPHPDIKAIMDIAYKEALNAYPLAKRYLEEAIA